MLEGGRDVGRLHEEGALLPSRHSEASRLGHGVGFVLEGSTGVRRVIVDEKDRESKTGVGEVVRGENLFSLDLS